jgi:hypothetical protein
MPGRRPLRPRHFVPLIGFVVPSLVIGYGFVLPNSCAPGINDLSIGFAASLIGAVVTYVAGIFVALRD